MKVAIFGASGFVGSTLVERLLARGGCEVVPCIHSSGNAWRLARLGIDLKQVDLLDGKAVADAVDGCTHIVNCSRGEDSMMLESVKNLLAAGRAAKVQQFVHLSSVMVYGDPPVPESTDEAAPTQPVEKTYGWIKLKQDEMVEAAARAGLPCTVLCPPNIAGPYSHYLQSVLGALNGGTLAIVDRGTAPCVLVDVVNLCHAIELALDHGTGDGKRLFVTDARPFTWAELVDELGQVAEPGAADALRQLSRAELASQLIQPKARPASILRSLKHVVSSEVRAAMRLDPGWQAIDVRMRRGVARMGRSMEDRLRLSIEGSLKVAKVSPYVGIDLRLTGHQMRDAIHSTARIERVLGYAPLVTPAESMRAFRMWYRCHRGLDDSFADLTARLG